VRKTSLYGVQTPRDDHLGANSCTQSLGHLPWECPIYSRSMHADHPWDVTFTSHLFPKGSLIVAHPTASSTPHAWILRDLSFSLTECWNVAWKPPFSAYLYCFGLPRSEASTPCALMPPPLRLPSLASFLIHWHVLPASQWTQPSGPHHNCGQRPSPRTGRYNLY